MIDAFVAAAQTIHVEAATRAYLDTLSGAARARSNAYFEGKYWLLLWNAVVGVLIAWAMLRFGWSATWRNWAERVTRRRWLQPALYAFPFFIASGLLALPWTIYTDYFREKQYDLMNMGFGAWIGEQAISMALGAIMGAVFLTVIFGVIRHAPRSWWLWGAGAITALLALGIMIAPVFISPLFNDYKPMAASPLRDQILDMARAQGVPADDIYVFDQSKQHKRISANVSGLGPTIRISLNDNLLNRSTPEEVKAVMGHELGHYVLNHIPVTVAALTAVFALGLFLLWRLTPIILARAGRRWGVRDSADPAVTPLFTSVFTLYLLAMTPVLNSLIRINESQADAFGLDAAREPDGFVSIAMKLSEYRKIEPSPLEEFVFFDHPSGATRVRMAIDWKARHASGKASPAPQAAVRGSPEVPVR
jgi:STE24 endopeptidase